MFKIIIPTLTLLIGCQNGYSMDDNRGLIQRAQEQQIRFKEIKKAKILQLLANHTQSPLPNNIENIQKFFLDNPDLFEKEIYYQFYIHQNQVEDLAPDFEGVMDVLNRFAFLYKHANEWINNINCPCHVTNIIKHYQELTEDSALQAVYASLSKFYSGNLMKECDNYISNSLESAKISSAPSFEYLDTIIPEHEGEFGFIAEDTIQLIQEIFPERMLHHLKEGYIIFLNKYLEAKMSGNKNFFINFVKEVNFHCREACYPGKIEGIRFVNESKKSVIKPQENAIETTNDAPIGGDVTQNLLKNFIPKDKPAFPRENEMSALMNLATAINPEGDMTLDDITAAVLKTLQEVNPGIYEIPSLHYQYNIEEIKKALFLAGFY